MYISEEHFQQFVEGSEKSFEAIFCQYYKTLVSYVMRHDVEQMEAEDVVIETFHHLWQIRKELKSPAALHTLLFTATHNRALNIRRNVQNRQRLVAENVTPNKEENIHDYLEEEEMGRLLDIAIGKLPRQCGQVILGVLDGKALQEIADSMQLSVNTVKTYKLRAIELLRKLLADTPFLYLMVLIQSK